MCLVTELTNCLIAEEDIVCYKIVNDQYQSPCREFDYPIGETVQAENFKGLPNYYYTRFDNSKVFYTVNHGLHTFETLSEASFTIAAQTRWIRHFDNTAHTAEKILKCVIPKGTPYYKGSTFVVGKYMSGYSSKFLTILNEVNL